MRHWAINGRFLAQPVTGVQRCAYEIVQALDDALWDDHPFAKGLDVRLVVPRGIRHFLNLRRIHVIETGRKSGRLWEQMDLPRAAPNGLVSLCNSGPIGHRRHIVCIHDLNTRIVPESYSWPFRAFYRVFVPALSRRAMLVSTVSQYSANQLEHFNVCDRSKIRVIPNGSEHACRWMAAHSEKTRKVAGKRTILTFGSSAPHKNLELMLLIAPDLERMGLQLAVIGGGDPRVFSGRNMPRGFVSPNITWLDRISDDELAALIEDCLCLAFPSLTEGFGLPPVEAMARGCPVVISNCASMPEVCGTSALYAAPDDPAAWIRQFERLLHDQGLRASLVQRGPIEAARHSWSKSAELYLRCMAECDGFDATTGALCIDASAATNPNVSDHRVGITSRRASPIGSPSLRLFKHRYFRF